MELENQRVQGSQESKRAIYIERTSDIYKRSMKNSSEYLSVHTCEGTTKAGKRTTCSD